MIKGNLKCIVLKALEKEELSGYGLMNKIQEKMGRKPSPGSMYPVLEDLSKNKLITKKVQGKKHLYKLSTKGKQEIKKFNKLKDNLLKNMKENIKMWGILYNEDVSGHIQAIEAMRKDTDPFREIKKESQEFKKALFKIYLIKQIGKHQSKIRAILNRATKELKKLK